MSERERKLPHFWINIGEHNLECTPENTHAYLHENPKHDYLFHIVSQDGDIMHGHHIFRSMLKEQFDIILARMERDGYSIIEEDGLDGNDLKAYYRQHPEDCPLPDAEENWGSTKREQARKWGQFVAHLAEQIANGKAELDI